MSAHGRTRLGIVQRVLPGYRAPLFDLLVTAENFDVEVFAGVPRAEEGIGQAGALKCARLVHAANLRLGAGVAPIYWQRGLRDWLEDFQPDVLVADVNPWMLSTAGAVRWMHMRDRPALGWGLGMLPARGAKAAVKSRVYRRALRKFDALIAYGSKAAEDFAALGFDRARITVAFNAAAGVPTGESAAQPLAGLDPAVPTMAFVGRLIVAKRLDLLFEALELVKAKTQLVVVGSGPEELRLRTQAEALSTTVVFAGRKAGTDLSVVLNAASLFVLPAAGGLAIQEAMAHGLPVVASFADGTEIDLVREGQNGYLVPPGDPQALAASIDRVLIDELTRRRMGNESRRIITEEINIETMAAQFANAVRAAIEKRRSGRA